MPASVPSDEAEADACAEAGADLDEFGSLDVPVAPPVAVEEVIRGSILPGAVEVEGSNLSAASIACRVSKNMMKVEK